MIYVYYTHTDFIDVIDISTNQLKDHNKILLINKNTMDLSYLYKQYKQVLFYDDSLPYIGRIFSCITKIDSEYILMINDTNAIIKKDDKSIEKLCEIAKEHNIDRIDLQYININTNKNTHHIKLRLEDKDYTLLHNKNGPYVYNVNPSIWKLSSFIDFCKLFQFSGYREIEHHAQGYCSTNIKVYRPHGMFVNAGWYAVLPFFQFIQITHGGTYLPASNNNMESPLLISEWNKIIKKFNLPGKRGWHTHKRIGASAATHHSYDNLYK